MENVYTHVVIVLEPLPHVQVVKQHWTETQIHHVVVKIISMIIIVTALLVIILV